MSRGFRHSLGSTLTSLDSVPLFTPPGGLRADHRKLSPAVSVECMLCHVSVLPVPYNLTHVSETETVGQIKVTGRIGQARPVQLSPQFSGLLPSDRPPDLDVMKSS